MTIYVFDMDGTLTPSRLSMTEEFKRKFLHLGNTLYQKDELLYKKEIESSSWFGFSFLINEESDIKRENVINALKIN